MTDRQPCIIAEVCYNYYYLEYVYNYPSLLQGWALTSSGRLKHSPLCVSFDGSQLLLATCSASDSTQDFELTPSGRSIVHKTVNKCLTGGAGLQPQLALCDGEDPSQSWEFVLLS